MINWNKKENIPNNTDWNSSQEDDLEKYVDRIVSALFEKVESKNNEIQKVEKIEELEETKKAVIEDSICTERLEKMVGARKKAEFVDDERDSILKNAIDKVTYRNLEEEKNLEHYYAELSAKSKMISIEYEENRKESLEEQFRRKYKVENITVNNIITKKQKKIKEKDVRAAGTSMKDIFNSENFKNMWEAASEIDDSLEIV